MDATLDKPQRTQETEKMLLRRRLAKAHRVLTAGGIWPLTKGHVSARVPDTDQVLILGHIHADRKNYRWNPIPFINDAGSALRTDPGRK